MADNNDITWLVEVREDNVWVHGCSCMSWTDALQRARKFIECGPVRVFELTIGRAFIFNTIKELEDKAKSLVG